MTQAKGTARVAVEDALAKATIENPLTAVQIALLTGVDVALVRTHIGNCSNTGLVYNVNPGPGKTGTYVWGQPKPKYVSEPVERYMSTDRYTGERAIVTRLGAFDAFKLCSIQNGEPVERKRPLIIGGNIAATGALR